MVNEEKEQIQEPELKTYYVLKLLSSGINKITLLKEIRKIKNCDLQTGKDIVDTPNSIIAYSEEQDTANEWKLVLEETGASIEIGIIQSSMPLMESSKLLEVSKSRNDSKTEEKSFITTLLLAVFFGWLGAHRFYTGYTGIGILQFCTFGGWGIWILIDLFSICTNNYKDINGNTLKGYNGILNIIPLLVLGFVIYAFCSPSDEVNNTEKEKLVSIEQVEEKHQTSKGIEFKILSKQVAYESEIPSFAITSNTNSLVLIVDVEIKNNSKEPYKPKVEAQLVDGEGSIYGGIYFKNLMGMLNSAQSILNPGMSGTQRFFFKIPEIKNYTIELRDGSLFSDPVSIKL